MVANDFFMFLFICDLCVLTVKVLKDDKKKSFIFLFAGAKKTLYF